MKDIIFSLYTLFVFTSSFIKRKCPFSNEGFHLAASNKTAIGFMNLAINIRHGSKYQYKYKSAVPRFGRDYRARQFSRRRRSPF